MAQTVTIKDLYVEMEVKNKGVEFEIKIDGKQHEERKDKDKIKDDYLISEGWDIIRVKWYNPINQINKEKLYEQIEYIIKVLH